MRKQKIVVIVGPTAVGKTALSIAVAKAVHGEVISADSRQVYQRLDSGSGKVTKEEMEGIPHHLLDVADPKEVFTASDFVHHGRAAIEGILSRGNVPLIVGGTGFYIDALLGKISLAEVPANQELRGALQNTSLEELQGMLQEMDPARFETIDTENPVRLIRAIEVAKAVGKNPEPRQDPLYDPLWLGLALPMDELKSKIATRLSARLKSGMLDEAKKLYEGGLSYERMEALGLEYRYMARHLQGMSTYEEMKQALETEIRKYAKRQMTWFKKNKKITWLNPGEIGEAILLVQNFIKN